MTDKKTKTGQYYPFALIGCLVIVIILIIAFFPSIKRQMNAWKLLPEPEKLTELYFTHPNNLPSTYNPGQSQTVSFTVHNLEYQKMNYKYEIIEEADNSSQSQLLASGSFNLKQDQYNYPSFDVVPADLGQRVQIEIKLSNVSESIDYWVVKGNS